MNGGNSVHFGVGKSARGPPHWGVFLLPCQIVGTPNQCKLEFRDAEERGRRQRGDSGDQSREVVVGDRRWVDGKAVGVPPQPQTAEGRRARSEGSGERGRRRWTRHAEETRSHARVST
jgi:hypothetical protein